MAHYAIEPRTGKYDKKCRFLSLARNLFNKYWKKLLDAATKTGLGAEKAASKKVDNTRIDRKQNRWKNC